jgi:hypothetical protein
MPANIPDRIRTTENFDLPNMGFTSLSASLLRLQNQNPILFRHGRLELGGLPQRNLDCWQIVA